MHIVKIVVLGAPGTGKSSMIENFGVILFHSNIQKSEGHCYLKLFSIIGKSYKKKPVTGPLLHMQFTTNSFRAEYCATVRPVVHTRTVMYNNRIYQLKIVDLPHMNSFPQNSLEEWNEGVSIRHASAYLLVYDASNLDTFHHLKTLKEQMYDSRDMHNVPVLVVANKYDMLNSTAPSPQQDSRERRDICSMVRKQWKLAHLECSAKYNWRIVSLFKEITRLCDILETAHNKDSVHINVESFSPLSRGKCAIS